MKRVIVAGAGLIGTRHIAEVERNASCLLAAIVEPEAHRAAQFGVPVFASIEDVTADADGIILATPTRLHSSQAIACARRGWDVLVEKPVADTVAAATAMDAAARSAGTSILVGHHRRHHPRVARLRELLDAGEIGEPLLATALWTVRKPDDYFAGNWRSGSDGSPVLINAVHDIDLLRHLFGEVILVSACGSNLVRGSDRVETAAIMLQFENGIVATIVLSDASPGPWGFESGTGENPNIGSTGQDMLFISGTLGAVSFPSLTLWTGSSDWSQAPRPKIDAEIPAMPEDTPLQRQLAHFVAVMNGEAEPLINAADAARTLAVTLDVEAQIKARGVPVSRNAATGS